MSCKHFCSVCLPLPLERPLDGNRTRDNVSRLASERQHASPTRSGHVSFRKLVNKPIAANSVQWKSKGGQDAIQIEKGKHEKRGTWNLGGVVELHDLLKQTRESGEEVILGGVHPVMYEKHTEDIELAEVRCRVVFTAPRARTNSGLIRILYTMK